LQLSFYVVLDSLALLLIVLNQTKMFTWLPQTIGFASVCGKDNALKSVEIN